MKKREPERFGTGHDDGLEPLQALDVAALDSVDALLRGMSQTAFGGRNLGEAADALEAMVRDEQCFKVVTISGAMTIAKQGLVLCEMIDRGWTDLSTWLETRGPICRNTIAALLLDELIEGARQHEANGFSVFQQDWQALDLLNGRSIEIQQQDQRISGVALGIENTGGLRVETAGEVRVFHAGEVSVFYD